MEGPDSTTDDKCQPTAAVMFESPQHCWSLLASLDQLRKQGEQCDVTLKTEGKFFPCHKAVLIGGCEYFRAMFGSNMRESQSGEVELLDIHPDVLECVLQYLYTGRLKLDPSTQNDSLQSTDIIKAILQTADLFQLRDLKVQCEQHLLTCIDTDNCLAMHFFAEMHSLESLKSASREMMLERFTEICENEDFCLLNASQLKEYVCSDRLNTPNEDPVYAAVKRWLQHDWEERKCYLRDVLCHVRFPLCSPQFFLDEIENDSIMSSEGCELFLKEYKEYHLVPARREEMSVNIRAQPRISQTQQRLVLLGGRDSDWKTLQKSWYLDQTKMQWCSLCDIPFDNFLFSVCCLNNRAYITGGYRIPHGTTSDLWEYSGYSQRWTKKADMAVAREDHGSVACNGAIYVTGGTSKNRLVLTHVEKYDPEIDEWKTMPDLLTAVYQPAVAAISSTIYVIGGTTYASREMRYVTNMGIQVLDIATQQWTHLTSTMFRITGGCATVLGTKIFLSCGYDKLLCSFDTASSKWEYHSIAPTGHARGRAVTMNGKILLIAGKYKTKDARYDWTDSIDVYDPTSKMWSTIDPPCAQPMTDFGAVLLNIAM